MQVEIAQLHAATSLSLCDVVHRLTVTERLFAGIDFEALQTHYKLVFPVVPDMESAIRNIALTYGGLAKSIRTLPEITQLPSFVLQGATREVMTTGYTLAVLRSTNEPKDEEESTDVQLIAEIEQETTGCISLLQRMDPALARPYVGARDALQGNNADRSRHILTSLRELWNHLLRRLAPDDLVMQWVPRDGHREYFHEGRPTRRTRVLYICRDLNHDPLTEFIVQDTSALVKLIDLFNRVHDLETELTDEQLRAIILKTDSWLMYILQISDGTKRP